ncbi:MAG: cupin domain-containing protein [Ruminococcaceae bacterium]|nr:cupin domain-containing protein [Oscillospiraceae bacterium]
MGNFSKVSVANDARTELHDKLALTGAEISVNALPAGACVPFSHYHKQNEEIYGILSGAGKAVIDGETVELKAGDWLRVSPAAKRQFFAADDSAISYICIQVKENSLEAYTNDDGVVSE